MIAAIRHPRRATTPFQLKFMALNFEPREGLACDDRAMTEGGPHRLGSGPLTAVGVLRDSLSMLRQSFVRIAGVAIVFFAVPALIAAGVVEIVTLFVGDENGLIIALAIASLLVATALQVLGPIAFAGFLDAGVANEYLRGGHRRLDEVLRTLSWKRLIAADLIVTVIVGIGLSLFIVPGLILYGLFGLIGPVVVQEGAGVRSSFARTCALARFAPRLVIILVVVPFAFEEVLHGVIFETLDHSVLEYRCSASGSLRSSWAELSGCWKSPSPRN